MPRPLLDKDPIVRAFIKRWDQLQKKEEKLMYELSEVREELNQLSHTWDTYRSGEEENDE